MKAIKHRRPDQSARGGGTALINAGMSSSGDFHQARKTWSRIKHSILGRYLSLLLDPITVFMEPINIRAENVRRIEAQAATVGMTLKTDVFASHDRWQTYAREALKLVHTLAKDCGLSRRLHLWPDMALGSQTSLRAVPNQVAYKKWLEKKWSRISEWPKK